MQRSNVFMETEVLRTPQNEGDVNLNQELGSSRKEEGGPRYD